MTTTRIPAFFTFGARDVPLGGSRCVGHSVNLVHSPALPCIARIEGVTFGFSVTIDGLSVGLVEEYPEPFGRIAISPSADGDGFGWVVVDIDGEHGEPNAQIWLAADKVAEFLVDVALTRILPAGTDVEHEWQRMPRRPEGGAA